MLNILTTIWFWSAFATIPTTAEPNWLSNISELFEHIAQKCSIDINAELQDGGSPLSWCLQNVLLNQGKQCIVESFHVYYYGEAIHQGQTTTLKPNSFESVDKYTNDHCSMDYTQHEQLSCILDELSVLACTSDKPTEPPTVQNHQQKNEKAGARIIQPTYFLCMMVLVY